MKHLWNTQYLILYINVHIRSRTSCIFYYRNRRTLDVDDLFRDASTIDNNISSVVNKVGLLTIEIMELFSCVDCAWYKSDAGRDLHRPMDMMFVVDTRAARAIVGADMHIECVSNHDASRPNTVAACLTANCMSLYNKHLNCPFARNDKKGSEPSRFECRAHKYTRRTKGTDWPEASVVENHIGTPKSLRMFFACNILNFKMLNWPKS